MILYIAWTFCYQSVEDIQRNLVLSLFYSSSKVNKLKIQIRDRKWGSCRLQIDIFCLIFLLLWYREYLEEFRTVLVFILKKNCVDSKNTCVAHTQVFVFQNTTLLSYRKTRVCVNLTQVLVLEMTTKVLCDTCSNTPIKLLPPAKGNLTIPCIAGECPIHWAIADISNDGSIVILIVTLTIMHVIV